MKNEHVLEQLSAYIDGESKEPERIARHLQQCSVCARRHMELRKMSSHLVALRGPEVHPAFRTRVLTKVAETQPPPLRAGRLLLWASLAAVLVICAATAAYVFHTPATPVSPSSHGAIAHLDDGRILSEIERRVTAGEEVTLALPGMTETGDSLPGAPRTAGALLSQGEILAAQDEGGLLDALASEEWLEVLPVSGGAEPDLSQAIEELDETERAIFKELLLQYAMEDVAS